MQLDGIRNSALVRAIIDTLEALPDLFRSELRLAQAEISEKIKGGIKASVWLITAAFLALVCFLILVEALIFGIASFGLALHWSCLIVAAVIGGIAAGAFFAGRSALPDPILPVRSARQVSEDVRTVKEQLS
ncbi:MAG: phage holin family protein [Alphaproteobacteria bacterium]|nr:phage holin family protein [Alphaproteobacteria bacterium]